jgi:hypothetical protein
MSVTAVSEWVNPNEIVATVSRIDQTDVKSSAVPEEMYKDHYSKRSQKK